MKNGKPVFKDYVFSDCREITGEELYLINGGAQIENTNEAVAGAQPGDTLIRDDGTEITITQGDIDWAKEHIGAGGNDPSQTTPAASEPSAESQPSTPTNSSSTTGSTSQANTSNPSSSSGSSGNNTSSNSGTSVPAFTDPFAPESNGNFEIDNKNKTVSADIKRTQSVIDAYNAYYRLSDMDYQFQLKDGNDVVHTFTEEEAAKNYIRSIDTSKGNLSVSEALGTISTVTSVANKSLDYAVDYIDDVSKALTIKSISKNLSKTSIVSGVFATGFDIVKAVDNPSFDTISDAVIDSIGLFPGGLAWSIGLDVAKTGAEKIGEEIEKGVQYYKDYKINEMYSAFLPENERIQNMFEPDNMFMKMVETGVKRLISRF